MEKTVIIGTGFIGGYMTKGLKKLLGSEFSDNVCGIKKRSEGLKKRSAELNMPIYSEPILEVLRREQPSLILLCPSPSAVPAIVENELLPYYNECRTKHFPLPYLISFAPSPSIDVISDLIGNDISCVKVLPNVFDNVKGIDITPIGINYVTPAHGKALPSDFRETLDTILSVYGETIVMNDRDSLILLSGKITSHVCCELCYAIEAACHMTDFAEHSGSDSNISLSINKLGDALRYAQHELFPALPFISPCEKPNTYPLPEGFMHALAEAWFDGLHRFTVSMNPSLTENASFKADALAFLLNVFPISFETKAELEQDTLNAATKGGVLERGVEYFYENVEEALRSAVIRSIQTGTLDSSFFARLSEQAENMSREAYKRSCSLTKATEI